MGTLSEVIKQIHTKRITVYAMKILYVLEIDIQERRSRIAGNVNSNYNIRSYCSP